MERLKIEGIVINAIPFKDDDCISTVFTAEEGLIKFFFKGGYKKRSSLTNPLTVAEIIYVRGKGELYTCIETTPFDHHLKLRENLPILKSACTLLQAIASTQQQGRPVPELYQLLRIYLRKLPTAVDPAAIAGSFCLKLLHYEGLFGLTSHCCVCAAPLNEARIYNNEAFCLEHTPAGSLPLTAEERLTLEQLTFCRDFSRIAQLKISEQLAAKISSLFHSCSST